MERDNFNPYKFESSPEKSGDKKDDKKKKKSATDLAKLLARQDTAAEKEKTKESELKHDVSPLEKVLTEKKSDRSSETTSDSHESDQEVPLESLSPSEQTEAAQAYIAERVDELANESHSAPDIAAETEANQAFIEALRQRLGEAGGEETPEEAIENAFQDVADTFEADDAVNDEISAETDADIAHDTLPDELHDFDPDQAVPLTPPAGGGGVRPPVPPAIPTPAFGEEPRPFAGSSVSSSPESNATDTADRAVYERRAAGRGLLVGGVVGYMIGRRRGRIKTEKRLSVVQEKLEKQVEQIQQTIEQKESAIRKLAHEKGRISTEMRSQFIGNTERQSSAKTERKTMSSAESMTGQPETANAAVDSLSKEELLAFSAQIKVGETNLRRVFEAKMIDEKGLRRLIKEYQAGHDLRRALAREFMVKELKFERDPTLRDLLPVEAQPRRQGQASEAVDDSGSTIGGAPMASTNTNTVQARQQTATDKRGANGTAAQSYAKRRQSNVSPLVLITLTLFTIMLALYAIWLTVTR